MHLNLVLNFAVYRLYDVKSYNSLYAFYYQVEQSHERERLKMRIVVLEESVKSCELECKAGRETVLRLMAELDQERRKTASSAAALDSLKVVLTQPLTQVYSVYTWLIKHTPENSVQNVIIFWISHIHLFL